MKKRVLSLLMAAVLVLSLVPAGALAAEGTPDGQNLSACICESKCTEGNVNSECPVCGAEGADLSACQGKEPEQSQENENSPAESEKSTCICTTKCAEGSVNPDCPVCSAAGADLAVCVGEASQPEPPQVTTIKTWNWIGGDNLNNGVLSLIGAGAENPVDFATVVSLLPTGITAAVEGSADPVELILTWSCGDFPKQATEGTYTFTAALPEGYALGEETAALTVPVILGGAQLQAAEGAPNSLYVGNYQITSGDTPTYLKAGTTEGSLADGSENDWTVKYDPATVTLA